MATWLVTGAGRGIGLGLSTRLLARGDHVIALVRHLDSAHELQKTTGAGERLTVLEADVTDGLSLRQACASLAVRHIDVLVNNAGVYLERGKGALDADLEALATTLMVNTVAPMRVIQAFAPLLGGASGTSKAVTISSAMGSFKSTGGQFVYRTSKAAINKAIQSVAPELLHKGIIAFVMHPGWVRTDMGGAGADISIEQSVSGLIATIDAANENAAGAFINYDGTIVPW